MYNSTIIYKKKMLVCGHFDFAFSKGRCKQCATIEDSLNRINKHGDIALGIGDLVRECDSWFSQYNRAKYADKNGLVKCYTCDTVEHWRRLENGHYITRSQMLLRFDERNCRPQCHYCNFHKRGNLLIFSQNLEAEHQGITEILYQEAKIIYKYTKEELKYLALDFHKKLNRIEKKLKQKINCN